MKKPNAKDSMSVVAGILGFLGDTGKTNLLPTVAQELDDVVEKSHPVDKIIITSAVVVSKDQIKKLQIIVNRYLQRDLPAVHTLDKTLLGGFSIRAGDFFLDASLSSEVAAMKRLLLT